MSESEIWMKNRSRQTPDPTIATEVPWADHLTAYDNKHLMMYLKLIDACADSASEEEMAQDILGIDTVKEPFRAREALRSHLERVRWFMNKGYKELFST
ncbi:DNA -binding domain-containing protein [Mesorhizobium shangrilense]|uniref:DUF2285 domain-containing protein n=1 Tax=Mesorhizobium shangrilense TaxID=460060 RepID=A0ABV2DRU5_9HYPH